MSYPSVDRRLFKDVPRDFLPEDTMCGPFMVGKKYDVMFHEADPRHERMSGRMVTFVESGTNSGSKTTRMVEFKIERVESK